MISLVEQRPAIWDKRLDSYKDKNVKEALWWEIYNLLKEDFDKINR